MTDNNVKFNQKIQSIPIDISNIDGVNYITARNLAAALGMSERQVSSVLMSMVTSIPSDAAIINVNSLKGGVVLCNARGFVACAHLLQAGDQFKARQAVVLDALLKGSESLSDRGPELVSPSQVLALRLSMTEGWLREAEAKLAAVKAQYGECA